MEREKVKVSIICPMYNCSRFARATIECVLNQTHQNFELIIVDDNSSDDTVEIIKSYKDTRIHLFVNETNEGAAYSRNKALKEASGDYIAFLDGDDLWDLTKLEKQLNFMIDNCYAFSYTNYSLIDADDKSLGIYYTGPKVVTYRMFLRMDYIGTSTVMYYRDVCPDLEIPNDIYKRNDDAMWFIVSRNCDCHLLNETLSKYRRSNTSISSTKKSKLFKYHVILYQKMFHFSKFKSILWSLRNVFYYCLKQMRYRKKYKSND